jgi:regulatory protein
MLARRELSEAQIRQRLAKRGESRESIDEAVDRLKAERSIDDERVAGAIARTHATGRNRGRRRVLQQIEAAGIDKSIASKAVDLVCRPPCRSACAAATVSPTTASSNVSSAT